MLYQKNYFSALTDNLSTRSERAAQGLLSLGNPQLRQFLHDQLTAAPGTPGAWLADPVFEPTFGWQESAETMGSLAGGNLLVVSVQSNPAPAGYARRTHKAR